MRRRDAFTLTELLVSLALIIFIMSILAEAFDGGIGTFRRLKAIGDMNDKLRATSATLRKYLSADHFEAKRRLSDSTFWSVGPPREGFFRIVQGTGSVNEGIDSDGLPSYRSTDHALHFAVKLRGNQRGEFFRAAVPSGSPLLGLDLALSHFQEAGTGTYCSPWAEVAFFLRPIVVTDSNGTRSNQLTSDPDNPSASGYPLYALYLRQRLASPDNSIVASVGTVPTGTPGYSDISCTGANPLSNGNFYFNSAADLAMPGRRAMLNGDVQGSLPATPTGTTPANGYGTLGDLNLNPTQQGNDLILTNVLSFDVRVLLTGGTDFVMLNDGSITSTTPANNPTLGTNLFVFDSWSQGVDESFNYSTWNTPGAATSAPLQISIRAIRVTIRVWDSRTFQTRQTSVIVDM